MAYKEKMKRYEERITKKKEQINRTQSRLKKQQEELKNLKEQRNLMALEEIKKVLNEKGLEISDIDSIEEALDEPTFEKENKHEGTKVDKFF